MKKQILTDYQFERLSHDHDKIMRDGEFHEHDFMLFRWKIHYLNLRGFNVDKFQKHIDDYEKMFMKKK